MPKWKLPKNIAKVLKEGFWFFLPARKKTDAPAGSL
jgi:hypothetical protein